MEQQILKDSTQTVRSTLPEFALGLGKLTAVSHKLRTPNTDYQTNFEAASYDATDTTVAANASVGATSISLTSGAGVTSGVYAIGLGADTENVLLVEVQAVSSNEATLKEPLPVAVSSGDLFFGWSVSHALLATETEDDGPGKVIWRATVGAELVQWESEFRIVNQLATHGLTYPALSAMFPVVRELQDPQDPTGAEVIEAAWRTYLVPSLESRGIIADRIVSWQRLHPWLGTACVYHLLRNSRRADPDQVSSWQAAMVASGDSVLSSTQFWYDTDDDEGYKDEDGAISPFGAYRKVLG